MVVLSLRGLCGHFAFASLCGYFESLCGQFVFFIVVLSLSVVDLSVLHLHFNDSSDYSCAASLHPTKEKRRAQLPSGRLQCFAVNSGGTAEFNQVMDIESFSSPSHICKISCKM